MKLLLVTYEYPPFHGGIARYLSTLMGSAPADVEVTVDMPPKGEHWSATLFRLLLGGKRPELMLVSHVLPLGYVAWVLKAASRVPYLVFTHGTDILSARTSGWKRFWMRFVLHRAKFVIANSRFTAGLLAEEGIRNAKIITPCLDVQSLLFRDRGKVRHREKPMITSVGRLVQRKGFDTMIRAMPAVLKAVPDARYVIIGSGAERSRLKELSDSLGLGESVLFAGDTTRDEMRRHLAETSVFVHPARQVGPDVEGFGLVVVEASAAGLPVVVGRSGGTSETVRDGVTGIVVEPDDQAGITSAIIRLLRDSDAAAKMGEAGRQFVIEKFDCDTVSRAFWDLITHPVA